MKRICQIILTTLSFAACEAQVKNFRSDRNSANAEGNFELKLIEGEIREDDQAYVLKVLGATSQPGQYVIGLREEPEHGKVSLGKNGSGKIEYLPEKNFNGLDRFVVGVVPESEQEAELRIEVKLRIIPVPDAPEIKPQTVVVEEDSMVEFQVEMVDGDGEALQLRLASEASKGSLEILDPALGLVRYTPKPNSSGMEQVSFIASDGNLDSQAVPIDFEIVEVNDPPVIQKAMWCLKANEKRPVPLFAEDPVENSRLTYAIDPMIKPSLLHGSISVFSETQGLATYDPTRTPGFQGWDLFYVKAFDQISYSEPAPIHILVHQAKFDLIMGNSLQGKLVDFKNIESVDGPTPSYQFSAIASNQGQFVIADPTKSDFSFTPNPDLTLPIEVTVAFKVKMGDLEAKDCNFKVNITAPAPPAGG